MSRSAARVLSVLGLAAFASHGAAATVTPVTAGRFVQRALHFEGESRAYAVWLPPGFESRRGWPAILFLHGTGESGRDGQKPTRVGIGPALLAHPERWPFVVVFPQKPLEQEEWEERETLVLRIWDRARREFRVDASRAALCGVSQGGHGAWFLGARQAGRWTSVVPICGYGRARSVASRLARTPVWAFHGLRDDVVDPGDSRTIVAAIRAERERLGLGPEQARLTLYAQANHNSWDSAFAEPELPVWILSRPPVAPAGQRR